MSIKEEFLKLLDVEIGEEFYLRLSKSCTKELVKIKDRCIKFSISKNLCLLSNQYPSSNGNKCSISAVIGILHIIRGDYEIVKIVDEKDIKIKELERRIKILEQKEQYGNLANSVSKCCCDSDFINKVINGRDTCKSDLKLK